MIDAIDHYDLRLSHKWLETLYNQTGSDGLVTPSRPYQHGFDLNTYTSLLALAFANIIGV